MSVQNSPINTDSWKALQAYFTQVSKIPLRMHFSNDKDRFNQFSVRDEGLLFDYSKNHIDKNVIQLFKKLFEEVELNKSINALFNGEEINHTENRSVLHSALRNFSESPLHIDGKNVRPEIENVRQKLHDFSNQVRAGKWLGYTGKPIKQIVNIGIGGSDLGPKMVTEALKPYQSKNLAFYFVSNIDGCDLHETLKVLNREETLFIISSKSFSTTETMTNAQTARRWFLQAGEEQDIEKHFVAVSTNKNAVSNFGINPKNMFGFWNWVGGRYSVWSSIGLPIILSIGFPNFLNFLKGAHAADVHFKTCPIEKNIPMLLAAIGIWYRNFWNANTHAILPYSQYLRHLPAYLQQADMESNGKSVANNGENVDWKTGPIIWGETGTNGQHAFYQLIHQGTEIIPCDFIAVARFNHEFNNHNNQLFANCLAQSNALMHGKDIKVVEKDLLEQGKSLHEAKSLAPFKVFKGNKPSTTFLLDELSPYNLGKLLAIYEHKIFVQGVVWNINSFDQWGVELGKTLATSILNNIEKKSADSSLDSSTAGLLHAFYKWS